MKKRNNNTVQIHISNGDVSTSEDPRYVKRVGKVEFITADLAVYQIEITDANGKDDPPVFVARHLNGVWRAHGREKDRLKYTVKTLLSKKRRDKKTRKTHTIIIGSGMDFEERRRKPPRKKAAKRAHTIIVHS
jgi:hypothetical protein